MTAEEIIWGESKNIEFKASLPDKSEKYIKTLIAFANCQGGKLIIGMDDKTRKVIGVDRDDVFQIMDSIANAVDDSCAPQIVPDIEPKTIDGKTVIVITVSPEPNRPYYLKAKGKEKGTFIRLAGTTRAAGAEKIRELEIEGARISWDELTCVGFPVTDKAVKKLCRDIVKYRRAAELSKKAVTKTQLINWKVLKEAEGQELATNAFALLTSDHFFFSKTQCAVFKGTGRSIFLDKREYTGPLYEQIEEAVAFVLRNIRLGATIRGLLRHEEYELPVEAIREMIVNAHCHRNMLDESCVQVAIYDDRLEVTSPGGLYNGLTYEQMMSGRSKLRNKAVANVFNQMGLIDAWGTGVKRIRDAAAEYGLPEPEFLEMDDTFRINLYRYSDDANGANGVNHDAHDANETSEKHQESIRITSGKHQESIGKASEKHRNNIGKASGKDPESPNYQMNRSQKKIIEIISHNGYITIPEISEQIGISERNVAGNIRTLKEEGILVRHGGRKEGYWEIIPKEDK